MISFTLTYSTPYKLFFFPSQKNNDNCIFPYFPSKYIFVYLFLIPPLYTSPFFNSPPQKKRWPSPFSLMNNTKKLSEKIHGNGATIRIAREIPCLPYARFLFLNKHEFWRTILSQKKWMIIFFFNFTNSSLWGGRA